MLWQATLDKVDQIQTALARFCPDEAERAAFQQVVKAGHALQDMRECACLMSQRIINQVFAADGEKAETWAGRAAKVKQVLPNLQASVRCCMHAGQRCMESAVRSDVRCEQLLGELVLKYSTAGDSKQPGSLARALTNSTKLAEMFRRHAEEFNSVDLLMGKAAASAPHFAAQRFDSLLSAVEKLLQNLEAVIKLLVELTATKCDQSKWAQQLLRTATLLQQARRTALGVLTLSAQVFTPSKLRLLALVAEWMSLCKTFIHKFDAGHA